MRRPLGWGRQRVLGARVDRPGPVWMLGGMLWAEGDRPGPVGMLRGHLLGERDRRGLWLPTCSCLWGARALLVARARLVALLLAGAAVDRIGLVRPGCPPATVLAPLTSWLLLVLGLLVRRLFALVLFVGLVAFFWLGRGGQFLGGLNGGLFDGLQFLDGLLLRGLLGGLPGCLLLGGLMYGLLVDGLLGGLLVGDGLLGSLLGGLLVGGGLLDGLLLRGLLGGLLVGSGILGSLLGCLLVGGRLLGGGLFGCGLLGGGLVGGGLLGGGLLDGGLLDGGLLDGRLRGLFLPLQLTG